MKNTKPIVEVKNVTKKFGSLVALDNVSFTINKGERVGIVGGNGAGKTTITEIIAGIGTPTKGEVLFNFKYGESPQEKIGMQFQDSSYPSGLTVKDIVKFAINLRKNKISEKELNVLLKKFQMEDFYTKKARMLSGGQRQKLNILISLLHKPELLILDEISTGLDIAAREDIIDFTKNLLNEGKVTSILISHHMAEITALCDRVIILSKGKIYDVISIKDVINKHKSLEAYMKKIIKKENGVK